MAYTTSQSYQEKRKAKLEAERSINSEQQFVGEFLEKSVGLYIRQKGLEHASSDPRSNFGMEQFTNEDMKKNTADQCLDLLDGLKGDSKFDSKKVDVLAGALKNNIEAFIDKMDIQMSKVRDETIAKNGITVPDPLTLDTALIQAAPNSDLIRASQMLKNEKATVKDTGWKKVANLFKKMGAIKLANFFDKKNEKAKVAMVGKAIGKDLAKIMKEKKDNGVASPNTPEKQQSTAPQR